MNNCRSGESFGGGERRARIFPTRSQSSKATALGDDRQFWRRHTALRGADWPTRLPQVVVSSNRRDGGQFDTNLKRSQSSPRFGSARPLGMHQVLRAAVRDCRRCSRRLGPHAAALSGAVRSQRRLKMAAG